VKNLPGPLAPTEKLHQLIFEGLCRVNQDFREVTKMFDPSCVEIQVYEFETGPFKERDIRIKNKYVALDELPACQFHDGILQCDGRK
jgi:hypothetical protein